MLNNNNPFKNYKNIKKWEKNANFQFCSANFIQRAPPAVYTPGGLLQKRF